MHNMIQNKLRNVIQIHTMYTVQKLLVEKMKGVLFLSNVSMKICRHFRNRETRIPAHLQDPYPDTGPLPGYRTPTRIQDPYPDTGPLPGPKWNEMGPKQ